MFRDVQDLGPVTIDSFYNESGLKLQSYVWHQVQRKKGIIIAIHGLTSHVKFEFLNHYEPPNTTGTTERCPRHFTYRGSWPETFNNNGFVFAAYDQQGHGSSEAWRGSRCNVESFDHLTFDALQFAIRINRLYNNNHSNKEDPAVNTVEQIPIFLLGISMGGGVVLRASQLRNYIIKQNALPPYVSDAPFVAHCNSKANNGNSKTKNGHSKSEDLVSVELIMNLPSFYVISMCPNLSVNNLSSTPINRLLLPLSRPISFLFPYMRAVTLLPNTNYPWIEQDRIADAQDGTGIFNYKIPTRIAYQNVIIGPRIFKDISLFTVDSNNESIKNGLSNNEKKDYNNELIPNQRSLLLIIHSKNDTMTDPSGSAELVSRLRQAMYTVEFWLLNDMWHYLTLEEGNQELRNRIISWMIQRCDSQTRSKY